MRAASNHDEAELALSHALAFAMCEARDWTEALRLATDEVCRATGWQDGQAWLASPSGTVELTRGGRASEGSPATDAVPMRGLDDPRAHLVAQACSTGVPSRSFKIAEWTADLAPPNPATRPFTMAIPLMAERQAMGALTFDVSDATPEHEQRLAFVAAATSRFGSWLKRKQAEATMRASEARLRLLLEHVGEAVILLDTDGAVETWTAAAMRTFGYSTEEIVGKPVSTFHTDPHPSTALQQLRDAAERGRWEVDDWRVRKDGSRFWAHIVTCPVLSVAGELSGYAKIIRDLTEVHETEELRAKYALALERSNRELEAFASIASHDLQEPLRKILAFSDRLRKRCEAGVDDKGRHYLDRMEEATRRMQHLVDDLLAYSRVGGRHDPLKMVDLNEVARGVLSDLERAVERSCATISIGALPTIEAEPTQMRQLFQNLLANAIKFQPAGRAPVVTVSAMAVEASSFTGAPRRWEVRFRDNGIGFDPKYRERIFGMLQRLHGRFEYEGTGMGLAICRKIVERHDGTIVADAVPNDGATFLVTLPISQKKIDGR